MKRFLLLLVILADIFCALAQTTPPTPLDLEIERAQITFDSKRYNTAAGLFKRLYDKIKDPEKKGQMAYMVALSYTKANNLKQAMNYFQELVNTQYPDPNLLLLYGSCLKYFERYEDANRAFYDFSFEKPKDIRGKLGMQSCDLAKSWKANPTRFAVSNVSSLNSPYSDYSPFIRNNKMFFSSSRPEATGNKIFEWTGQKCSDLFEATRTNDLTFQKATPLRGVVNTPENEGAVWVDSNVTIMLYTQCNGADGKSIGCKIYSTSLVNGEWTNPQPLPFCSDSVSCGQPAFSPDGKRLFFSSDMKGSLGEKDIYVVTYQAATDKWGTPQNLGPSINTVEDDMFPYVDKENTLYFSSKGHLGMGGLDLFTSREEQGKWTKAENMKYPVNSGGDDFGLVFLPADASRKPGDVIGYFCSNRTGGAGDDDIYALSTKPFIFMVKGRVFDKETKSALPQAQVNIVSGKPFAKLKTGEKGDYVQELTYNSNFSLTAAYENYFSSIEYNISTFNLSTDSTLTLDIYLEPLPAPEQEITLKGIYYDLDKYDLRAEAKTVLDSLVKILLLNPNITIEIASHTDSRSDAKYNLTLSQKRAQSCVDYLLSKGIEKKRLTAVGYGEERLVNDCIDGIECTEAQHQQNRRTTFRVLTTDYKK